jgi:flagellar basal body rod protein FlgG
MTGSPVADALDRIAARAQDLRDAYRDGAIPANTDVRAKPLLAPSRDPLSVALAPNAWLVGRGADGAAIYTRNGALSAADGVVRTSDGNAVLGFPSGDARGAVATELRVPERDRALGRAADLRVEADGTLAYTRFAVDPRSGVRAPERVMLGRVALARFPAASAPRPIDGTRFSAPEGVIPHVGMPGDGTFASLATGVREAGSLDIDAGLQRLQDAYLAFEAVSAAQRAHGKAAHTIMDLVK